MVNRGTKSNLVLSLAAFIVFMLLLVAVVGSGVGTTELAIWLGLVAVGIVLIVRRYRAARGSQ